ncbi:MAG: BREX system serine/threonine kinase PglW, partial [Acidothermales bacterium]|nr:BREX system serine/threonine kinase PglW [Acidothermales bacterium]
MANRWWGPPSGFPWEEEALAHIREQMPATEPYRAWQTFTFTAQTGQVYECDLLIATPSGLHLVEIKSHPGRVVNSGSDWTFHMPDGRVKTIDNPLHLTDRKCKELKTQLQRAAKRAGIRLHIPYIKPAVFLSDPGLDCRLDEYQRTEVYGREGRTALPGIWSGLLGRPARDARTLSEVTAFSKQMDKLRTELGLQGARRAYKIGSLELEQMPMDRGPGWEDFLARNPAMKSDPPRRVRVYLSQRGATREQKKAVARAARREYKSLIGVEHDGIVRAENYSDEHDDGPAIVFRHGDGWQRLDHFMSERGAGLEIETRVEMVRQLAEAVDHAHRRRLYHRALSARSVYVDLVGGYPRLRIADWQTAARERGESQPDSSDSDPPSSDGSLQDRVDDSSVLYRAPEFGQPAAEGGLLDVFGLGALAYLLLTGHEPAADQGELQTALRTKRALIPSAVSDEITPGMDDLVRQATAVEVTERTLRVRDFLNRLEDVEEELTAPQAEVVDPLEAGKDSVIEGWTVERVLGKGSTARALLVAKDGHHRVLKVGLNDDANLRLMSEAETLDKLHSHYVVRMIEGPRFVHVAGVERAFIIMEQAGPRTLAEELRMRGRLPAAGPLEKLGEDLLRALEYLEEAGVWHRDIKPANLAIQKVEKQRERLVLFDFSLSGAAADRIQAGTPPYLDPFLGIGDRTEYDDAAERYAAAVTLHEMATGELPSWADGVIPAEYADADELTPQVSADMLDERVRDKLAAFFRRALHRDAGARYRSAKEMVRAWMEAFGELDRDTTPTTRDTLDDDLGAEETNRRLAETAEPATSLRVAGLSGRAQSVAEQQLHVSTVGELMEVPTARIRTVRGVGIEIRNELARKAKMWRRKFAAAERADTSRLGEPARLTVDQFTDRLAETGRNETQRRVVRLALALPGPGDTEPEVPAWAAQGEVGRAAGVHQSTVAQTLGKARQSWLKLGKIMSAMREDVLAILDDHGRVLGAAQLAGELLNLRGCTSDDPTARRAYAEAAVR